MGEDISIDFIEDNYFSELKENEILRERLDMLSQMQDVAGKYFSNKWIRNNILRQTDEDIERIDKEIESEKAEEPAPEGDDDPDSGGDEIEF